MTDRKAALEALERIIGMHYILDGKKAIPVADVMTWARWFDTADRHVSNTERGGVRVSTVFLGIDHRCGDGPPQIFETMVFGGEHDQDMDRYSTWEEAEAGHAAMCAKVLAAAPKPEER